MQSRRWESSDAPARLASCSSLSSTDFSLQWGVRLPRGSGKPADCIEPGPGPAAGMAAGMAAISTDWEVTDGWSRTAAQTE